METTPRPILLVEDDPDDEELIVSALERYNIGHALIVKHDGVEAIEYLLGTDSQPPGELPRVILLDLKLPRLSGLRVLERLRSEERTCLVPVVVLTSSDEERDIVESYRLGVNSYVHKPVDFAEFSEAAGQLGLYWVLLNRQAPLQEG